MEAAEVNFWMKCVADVELVCLASWKIGSERYAFGYLTGAGFTVKRDAYRCLVSETYRNAVV